MASISMLSRNCFERNGLVSMLVAEYLAYPLAEIESPQTMGWVALTEAYKRLIELRGQQHWEYGSAEKLVHIKCKQSIRKTIDLPSLTFAEIDAFPASPVPVGPDHVLSPHEPADDTDAKFSRDQLMIVATYIDQNIPSVANHLKALVHE